MNKDNLKNLINESRRKQDSKTVSLLSFLLGEFELQKSKNSNITMDQIIHKALENNHICLAARHDEELVEQNKLFASLLPSYLSVAELRGHLEPLGLGSDGKSMGAAIKHMKSTGLSFKNEDIKEVLSENQIRDA